MGVPHIVLSFNRPATLRQVLRSLKKQTRAVDDNDLYLFQDWVADNADDRLNRECVAVFSDEFPHSTAFIADRNLGIGLHFEKAEHFAFEKLGAEIAYFFEDDLLLGSRYLEALDQMGAFALADERIAYVAAYGNHRADFETQKANQTKTIPLGHKWGFGLTRRQWLKQKPIVDGYLDIIRDKPYAMRDATRIGEYFASLGYGSRGTSQDAAKDVASCVLGTAKLNTFCCYAMNIGRVGTHSNDAFYEREGFARAVVNEEPVRIATPQAGEVDAAIAIERSHAIAVVKTSKLPQRTEPKPMDVTAIQKALFGGSPYEGFAPIIAEPDLQGWNGLHPALGRSVRADKPAIIVDLGVWKGQSTVTLAREQAAVCPEGFVIAIDSFLGSPEHWNTERTDVHTSLRFQNGRPAFYETFLSNIVLSKLQDRILPLAQTSENAALLLKKHGVRPNLVHIDAAHEYEAVMRDMKLYWDLLAPGGLLMGDDFPWVGVAKAVVHFSDQLQLPFAVENPKWWIRKPR